MKRSLTGFMILAAAVLAVALQAGTSTVQPPDRSVQNPEWGVRIETPRHFRVERSRVARHLAGVERHLRAVDVSRLRPEQQSARLRNLDRLRAYRKSGVFPHNHVVRDHRTPVFIDDHGTLCAVGYLIVEAGHEGLARRIAATRNLARLPSLAGDPELAAWLEREGLGLEEAAMIQPTYGPIEQRREGGYDTATILATGLSGSMIAWNLLSRGRGSTARRAGGFGLGVGLAQVGLGGLGLVLRRDDSDRRDVEIAHVAINVVVGSAAALLGLGNLASGSAESGDAGSRRPEASGIEWSVSPAVVAPGRAGLRLALRF
jgi:hypothetical protein